jgi:hypothetical protein
MRQAHTAIKSLLANTLIVFILLGVTGFAHAKEYLIEVVVFEHLQRSGSSTASGLYYPKLRSSMGLKSERAQNAGFELITEGLTLNESADKIKSSGRYRVLKHFAWRQPGLERSEAKAVRINLGSATTVYLPEDLSNYKSFIPASSQPQADRTRKINTTTVNGTIKVSLGRFLHMDAHMVFTDTKNGVSYGLLQSRKMRSKELHYIDNQRFGILTRILPITAETDS